jgi:hypothetical protein
MQPAGGFFDLIRAFFYYARFLQRQISASSVSSGTIPAGDESVQHGF